MLQFLVFHFLEEKITRLDKNSRLIIKTESANGSTVIRIIPEGNILDIDKEKGMIPYEMQDNVVKRLGGNILQENEKTVISLPVSVS